MFQKLDPKQYPTLAAYNQKQIWDAVAKLQEKYPDMTENQCLINLEMDLGQIQQQLMG